jgi:PAS domain S-box-containing protein
MKTHVTPPTGRDQTFEVNETFFSTTDERGVITAGNDVFSRTSGYGLDALIGQSHNIVRHPDMPRVVFRQMWETIRAGKSFAGYVKNQARNGDHYWVFAMVVPTRRGFLSVRIKPSSPVLAQVEAIYRRLVAKEAAMIAAGSAEVQATDAAHKLWQTELSALGFSGCDAFSRTALNTEITCRDAEIARRSLRLFSEKLNQSGRDDVHHLLSVLYPQVLSAYADVNALCRSLNSFRDVCREIQQRTESPVKNGLIESTMAPLTTAVEDIVSSLSIGRIQIEMLLSYVSEIGLHRHHRLQLHQLRAITEDLGAGFVGIIERAFGDLERLLGRLFEILGTKELLRKNIESRPASPPEVRRREIARLDQFVAGLSALTVDTPQHVETIRCALLQVRETLALVNVRMKA